MPPEANIVEIFSSLQGEGPYQGERHLFVRFQGCFLKCRYCDTPEAFVGRPFGRIERRPFSGQFEYFPNPIALQDLNILLQAFHEEQTLAITGGEPLEQVDFLKAWLPSLHGRYRILLESAGIDAEALKGIIEWVDTVSMDLKLPSVGFHRELWDRHRAFAKQARSKDLYFKIIVSSGTEPEDLQAAISLARDIDESCPFILQPVTGRGGVSAPSLQQLNDWRAMAHCHLSDVRVISQFHKAWNIL